MAPVFAYPLTIVAGYLLGSVSASLLLSRFGWGKDVRSQGSGNAGATNMARVFGWGAGFATLGGDMLKAGLAMWLGQRLLGDVGIMLGGMSSMVGHCFPLFHHFRGGKGISVGAMIGLAIDWRVFVGIIAVFLLISFLTKKVSLGSLAASLSIALLAFAFHVSVPKLILAVFACCFAIFQHRSNIKRLADGTEADFKAAESKKNE